MEKKLRGVEFELAKRGKKMEDSIQEGARKGDSKISKVAKELDDDLKRLG